MQVYQPAEDSYLLSAQVKKYISHLKNKNIRILDMGTGSGIQAETCLLSGIKKENILSVDINPDALKFVKKLGISAIKSDLFSKINEDEKFNLIIFNPPYLPEDKYDKEIDTTGGKEGYETILKFLKQAKSHLTKNGIILLLISTLSKPEIIKKEAKKLGYNMKKLAEKGVGFFESLHVYKLSF